MPLLSEEVQLGYSLEAFAYAYSLGSGWCIQKLLYLSKAGINSMNDLATGCKDETINLDLELFGISKEERISIQNIQRLKIFLPGPVGFRAFRLAQLCAKKVRKNEAETNYVHRPEDGKIGKEKWIVPVGDDWTLNVDCAGFVRNVLKHVTKDPFRMALSDRDFMRAKDFYKFFETLPYSCVKKSGGGGVDDYEYETFDIMNIDDKRMKWRLVTDLRMVIPGDVIVYRPKGNAAGGSAFTENDRKDIKHLLKAIKTAVLWNKEEQFNITEHHHKKQKQQQQQQQQQTASEEEANNNTNNSRSSSSNSNHKEQRQLVTRNIAKDPCVKPWVESTKKILDSIGIDSVSKLKSKLDTINTILKEENNDLSNGLQFSDEEIRLMKECCDTTAMNTGHIVFASGPAVLLKGGGNNDYRIKIIHSTKYGQGGNQGIEEFYRRFQLVKDSETGKEFWTREPMRKAKPLEVSASNNNEKDDHDDDGDDDDDDNPNDDMEEDPDDTSDDDQTMAGAKTTEIQQEAGSTTVGDDLAGQAEIEVLAARMCF